MRVIIDTCVIVDALQDRKPFSKEATAILLASANKEYDGFISAKSLTDIYYLTNRLTHSNDETRKILNKLLVLFSVLDTTGIDCQKAVMSDTTDFEDAVMIETAIRSNVDCIVTRNIKDYTSSTIKVYTPSEFLNELNKSLIYKVVK